jgi:hypothetical protein
VYSVLRKTYARDADRLWLAIGAQTAEVSSKRSLIDGNLVSMVCRSFNRPGEFSHLSVVGVSEVKPEDGGKSRAGRIAFPARPFKQSRAAIRSRFGAGRQRTGEPACDANGSKLSRGWFARDVVSGPGRSRKCSNARCWNADTTVNIIPVRACLFCHVPRGHMAFTSHSGSRERRCGDHCGRQQCKFSHLISPFDMKSNNVMLLV